jgi:hypothetical protein
MCDSEFAREFRREEWEAYLAELSLPPRAGRLPKITVPVAAVWKTLLKIFRQPLSEKPAHR